MRSVDVEVLKTDVRYIKEAVEKIEKETSGVRVHKWAIGILFTWCGALTAAIMKIIL